VGGNMENHKGTWCKFKKTVFCQEGYCNGGQIFLDWAEKMEEQFEKPEVDSEIC